MQQPRSKRPDVRPPVATADGPKKAVCHCRLPGLKPLLGYNMRLKWAPAGSLDDPQPVRPPTNACPRASNTCT
eukprot:4831221-Lingulodinium_polyedra.AAC.1